MEDRKGSKCTFFITLFQIEGTEGMEQEATKPKTEEEEKRTTSVGKRTVLSI